MVTNMDNPNSGHDNWDYMQQPLCSPKVKKKSPWVWVGLGCGGFLLIALLVCGIGGKKLLNFGKTMMIKSIRDDVYASLADYSTFNGDSTQFDLWLEDVKMELRLFEKLDERKKISFADLIDLSDQYDSYMTDSLMRRHEAEELYLEIVELNEKYNAHQ